MFLGNGLNPQRQEIVLGLGFYFVDLQTRFYLHVYETENF